MARRSKDKAGIIVRREKRGLMPVSAFDAEQLDRLPLLTEFDLTERTRRTLPLQRTYWKALSETVAATGRWSTAENLHDALRRDLGYVTAAIGLDGRPYIATDSTAFDAMRQSEFKEYFDQAMARLAEVTGFDPLGFLGIARGEAA
jgi:hypothetical protein